MEMDGLDSANVKNPREGTQGILEFVNEEETKTCIVSSSPKAKKRAAKGERIQ